MISPETEAQILRQHALQTAGAPLTHAKCIVVALHGRGADAGSILELGDLLARKGVAYLAPQARYGAWYPQSFIAPVAANEPYLKEALAQVHAILDALFEAGVPDRRTGLLGFSQGACLALESVLRRPRQYGAVLAFSGGYIGPLGPTREPVGRLDGAKILLGCSDVDPHIPLRRVTETTVLLRAMGADVTERIYQGLGHAINDDEIVHARRLLAAMLD